MVLVFGASLERRVDVIKNNKSEIILKFPHLLFATQNFQIYWDTLLYNVQWLYNYIYDCIDNPFESDEVS